MLWVHRLSMQPEMTCTNTLPETLPTTCLTVRPAPTPWQGARETTLTLSSRGDSVIESAGEGTDLVQSSITWTLAANVENLTLIGTAALNGSGNALANTLVGNAGANLLDGGTGADLFRGGAGNDTYFVDATTDVIAENANEGTDVVQSSLSWTLGTNVENLTLTGTVAVNGTGNVLANSLVGNVAANLLNGGAGADTMRGGAGNDTYVVDSTADVITEAANEGTDLVQASVTWTLGANVEDLDFHGCRSRRWPGKCALQLARWQCSGQCAVQPRRQRHVVGRRRQRHIERRQWKRRAAGWRRQRLHRRCFR